MSQPQADSLIDGCGAEIDAPEELGVRGDDRAHAAETVELYLGRPITLIVHDPRAAAANYAFAWFSRAHDFAGSAARGAAAMLRKWSPQN